MDRAKSTHAYIGICEGCGMTKAACAITPDLKRTGEQVADMIACGLIVERVPLDQAVLNFGSCKCPKPVQEALYDN